MLVDVIDTFEQFKALRANWDAVYEADPEARYYFSWLWLSNWFEWSKFQWFVLAAKPSPAAPYVAFFPLQLWTLNRKEGGFYNDIRMGGFDFAGYTGLICDAQFQDSALPAFASHLQRMHWTNLHLENITASDERLRLLVEPFADSEFVTDHLQDEDRGDGVDRNICPHVKLPSDWDTYLATHMGPNTRKKARRYQRMLDASGPFRVTHADSNTFERDLNILLQNWETKWGPEKGDRNTRIILSNFRAMFSRMFKAGSLLLPALWQDDKPLSAQAVLMDRAKRSLLCVIGARDLAQGHPSPGFMLDVHSIRWAIENGFTTYDLMRGNEAYKYQFGCDENRVRSVRMRTRTGRNLGGRLDARSVPVVLSRANEFYKAGKLVEAEHGYQQILQIEPEHTSASALLQQVEIARAQVRTTDFDSAFSFHQRGRLPEAAESYRAILVADPNHFNAAHMLGVVLLQQGQFETAERQLALAATLNPEIAAVHNNRANALKNLDRLDEALASYDQAIALKPDYPEAFNNRGNALRSLKRFEDALESYARAIALRPDYPEAIGNRAKVLADLRRRGEASVNPGKAGAVSASR